MKKLVIAGVEFSSRLFVGTGKFPSPEIMARAVAASGTELVTVALRRVDGKNPEDTTLAALHFCKYPPYAGGRGMMWPVTARRTLDLIAASCNPALAARPAGPIGLTGLLRICDDTGILQHSVHSVPDRAHGYCVDDNARALMLANRLGPDCEPHRSQLATTFAAFVQSAWNAPVGEFRNFMGYGRNWLEERGSEDSCGRTLWALGATACEGQTAPLRRWALGLFDQAAGSAQGFGSPRASAFAMLGADYLLRADPRNRTAWAHLARGSARPLVLFRQTAPPPRAPASNSPGP